MTFRVPGSPWSLTAVLIALGLLTSCVSDPGDLQERIRQQAATLARADAQTVARYWGPAVLAELAAHHSAQTALGAGRKAALGAPVAHWTFAGPGTADASVSQPVALVTQVSGDGNETVRVCALLSTSAEQKDASIGSFVCPPDLPTTIPGLGTITATYSY